MDHADASALQSNKENDLAYRIPQTIVPNAASRNISKIPTHPNQHKGIPHSAIQRPVQRDQTAISRPRLPLPQPTRVPSGQTGGVVTGQATSVLPKPARVVSTAKSAARRTTTQVASRVAKPSANSKLPTTSMRLPSARAPLPSAPSIHIPRGQAIAPVTVNSRGPASTTSAPRQVSGQGPAAALNAAISSQLPMLARSKVGEVLHQLQQRKRKAEDDDEQKKLSGTTAEELGAIRRLSKVSRSGLMESVHDRSQAKKKSVVVENGRQESDKRPERKIGAVEKVGQKGKGKAVAPSPSSRQRFGFQNGGTKVVNAGQAESTTIPAPHPSVVNKGKRSLEETENTNVVSDDTWMSLYFNSLMRLPDRPAESAPKASQSRSSRDLGSPTRYSSGIRESTPEDQEREHFTSSTPSCPDRSTAPTFSSSNIRHTAASPSNQTQSKAEPRNTVKPKSRSDDCCCTSPVSPRTYCSGACPRRGDQSGRAKLVVSRIFEIGSVASLLTRYLSYSDENDESRLKGRPSWTYGQPLADQLRWQKENVNTDDLFGQVRMSGVNDVLSDLPRIPRSSSANWAGDLLTKKEVIDCDEKLGLGHGPGVDWAISPSPPPPPRRYPNPQSGPSQVCIANFWNTQSANVLLLN